MDSLAEQEFRKCHENIKKWRAKNYVSCWYQSDYESFRKWQDKTLAYHSGFKLEEKEIEELSEDERIRRFQAIMNERYGKKES